MDEKETRHCGSSGGKNKDLVIWITNADVLTREKVLELKYKIEQEVRPPHIIAISEVKLKYYERNIEITEYQLDGYNMEDLNIMDKLKGRGMRDDYIHHRVTAM